MIWFYALSSVVATSLISLAGIFSLYISQKRLEKIILYFVSFSVGTLLGDAFIHLIPESFESSENPVIVSLYILSGILVFFVLEKFIHWQHCHERVCEDHPHPFSYVILIGDGLHNLIDGMVIAASYLVSVPVGIATTIAVILHEIPQEIGDFGTLVYGGFSKIKALLFNFATALTAIAGALAVLVLEQFSDSLINFLIPFAGGGFIYIASSDLIPELHKHTELKKSFIQLVTFILGIALMFWLLVLE